MMAGQPKQFGLIMPKKNQLSAPKAVNVFGEDSDLDEDDGVDWVQKSLKAEGEKNRIKKQARLDAERALAEDPTIYQYDEIYAEIHVDTKKKKEEKKNQNPKYIGKLLENAEKRKRENEVRIERMVQKEREAEGDMFKDKEKFVTASYRKKLEENKKLEEEEKEKERLEAIGDVTKQVNIDGFYRHFFSQTFETGAKKETVIKKEVEVKKESKIEKMKSNERNLDADDSSVNDSGSDDQQNKNEALKIITKNRKGKQYRKKVVEASESESEEEKVKENEEDNESKEVRLVTETTKDENTEEHSSKPEITQENKEEKEDKDEIENKEDLKNSSSKRKKENEEKPKARKTEKNISIWEKRTVGPVFESALQRYYARQAMRSS